MATKTSRNNNPFFNKTYRRMESDVELVADTIILEGVQADAVHNFIGVLFFSDAAGTTPVVPGAGTVDITVETVNNAGTFEAIPDTPLTAATPETLSWNGNTKSVKAIPAGITTATHYKVVWTGNIS